MARDLVRDPDELDDEERPQPPRRYIIPGPNRPVRPGATPPPQPPDLPADQTLPSTGAQPAIPPPPTTLAERLQARESVLESKLNPPPAATRLGRVGRVLGTIGQDIGTAYSPALMEHIPGTTLNRRAELQNVREALGQEQARETLGKTEQARTAIEQQKADIEARKAGLPHMLPGEENVHTLPSGQRNRLWDYGPQYGNRIEEIPEGAPVPEVPPSLQGTHGRIGALPTTGEPGPPPPTAGALPQVYAPPSAAAAAAPGAAQGYWGKAKTPSVEEVRESFLKIAAKPETARSQEEQTFYQAHLGEFGGVLPVTAAEMKTYNDDLNSSYRDAVHGLGKDAPKPQLVVDKDNHDLAEKKKGDYSAKLFQALEMKKTRDLQSEALRGKLEDQELKRQTETDQGFVNLYSQQNYQRAIEQWHKSGNFAVDSGLITEQLAKQGHRDFGVGGIASGVGVLAANPYVAAAAIGAETLLPAVQGTISGYLDTLKKAGISPQGYEAMQAYYNAMIGRMLYEVATLKLPATALRSATMVEKILGSVPPPNTPPDAFKGAFDQYYRPMETMTKRRPTPPNYTPPRYEDIYPPATPAGAAPGAKPAGASIWNPQTRRYESREVTTPQ